MDGIEGDDDALLDAEFGQKRLRRRDFVGFLGDVDMGEDEGGFGGEGAQDLGGGAVVEIVEAAAQHLAVERDAAPSGRTARRLKPRGMAAEYRLDRSRIEPLEDITDRRVGRRPFPAEPERGVQPAAMDIDEGGDAAIRVAARHHGKDREQQDVFELVFLPLPAAWVRNLGQQGQQWRKTAHGNLQIGCSPMSQTFPDSGIPFPANLRTS